MIHPSRRPRSVPRLLVLALGLLLSATAMAATPAPAGAVADAKVQEVHRRAFPLDAHADVLLPSTNQRYYGKDGGWQTDFDKLVRGGVATIVYSVAVATGPETPDAIAKARAEADERLAKIRAVVAEHPERLEIARSAADIERIRGAGRIAVLIGFQNAYPLGKDVAALDTFIAQGVRLVGFNHAGNNAFSDSSRPQKGEGERNGGLSPLGKEAVQRLNRQGVIIDVSQLTPKALLQTLELTRAPVVASHSDVRALIDDPRNLSDAELDAIKKNGGVVHVTPFNAYLARTTPEFKTRITALRKEYGLTGPFKSSYDDYVQFTDLARRDAYISAVTAAYPKATVADLVDHIDYIVKRIGIDHVGIGSDFNHGAGIQGYADASEAPNVTRELLRRGYSDADIAKIWSGNFLRVFKAVEKLAKK